MLRALERRYYVRVASETQRNAISNFRFVFFCMNENENENLPNHLMVLMMIL